MSEAALGLRGASIAALERRHLARVPVSMKERTQRVGVANTFREIPVKQAFFPYQRGSDKTAMLLRVTRERVLN